MRAGSGSATAFQPALEDASTSSSIGGCAVIFFDRRCFVDCARLRMSCRPESSSRLTIGGITFAGSAFPVVVPVLSMLLSPRRASVRFGRSSK